MQNSRTAQLLKGLKEQMQGYEISFTASFDNIEDALELLLNTARQPTVQEQCDRDHIECEWHTNPHGIPTTVETITFTRPEYEDEDIGKIEIISWPHGEIKQYIEYWASDPTQRKTYVGYYDPHVHIFVSSGYNQIGFPMTTGHHKFNTDTTLTYTDRTVTVGHNGTTATYNDTTVNYPPEKIILYRYSHDTDLLMFTE